MSDIAVKLDENLSETHVECVRAAGYSADRVTDQGLSGAHDDSIWKHIVTAARFFITLDTDFADVRQFAPGSHPGLLLMRPHKNSRAAVLYVLERVLREHSLSSLAGCLVVADESQTRIRRPPDPRAVP